MEKQQLEALLKEMSLEEKVGQLFQIIGYYYVEEGKKFITGPDSGLNLSDENGALTGSVLGLQGAELSKKIQKEYMEHQPHHIPLLFMMDVIHGMKTIFPAPLAQAATFEPELTKEGSEIAGKRGNGCRPSCGFFSHGRSGTGSQMGESGGIFRRGSVSQFLFCESPGGRLPGF